ncbi:cytochrome P450 [Nocardioides sp. HDW12B]|uniref:cytochrome P450 n=1 Tax=Nocardioides sp. HDW12B TaxID=2714939 RepID=UPI00140E2684|nr:cytochrome P450 [Nocardioides sp. HDW12B]QIK68118.1 cytochrome P450 [Nocardioides sp. HDW12B]
MIATVRQTARWALSHGLPSVVMRRQAARGDIQGRLVSQGRGMNTDAVAAIAAEVRADGPLHRSHFAHITASLPTVKEVLTSNDFRTGVFDPGDGLLGRIGRWAEEPGRLGPLTPPSLLVTEPPDHTRYRKLVTRVFTARAVEGLRVRTQEIADELLDELAASEGPVDLVSAYCSRLPVTVIAEILGVPPADHDRVLEFGTAAAPSLDLGLTRSEFRHVERGLGEFQTWLAAHLAHLRDHPGEDLMSQLVRVRDEGQGLSDEELMATAGLVLAAGFETTVNLLGNGIALLLAHPDQRARLVEDPSLWSNAVDEVLRLDPPVLLTGRLCVRDTEVAGQPVPRGSVVTTLLAGANRDPDVFEDADRFDVARPNARDHVSFSAGRHFCLGAALARMEGEVGLRSLLERYPDLELLPGAQRRSTRILRGYAELPARLTPP